MSIWATTSGLVRSRSHSLIGAGMVMVLHCPQRKRMLIVISSPFVNVTSSMSKAVILLCSRCAVNGSPQRAGKSLASSRIRSRCFLKRPGLFVPMRFERIRHEPASRIDFILSALDLSSAKATCFFQAFADLLVRILSGRLPPGQNRIPASGTLLLPYLKHGVYDICFGEMRFRKRIPKQLLASGAEFQLSTSASASGGRRSRSSARRVGNFEETTAQTTL